MNKKFARQWVLLTHIPESPRHVSMKNIIEFLYDAGIRCSVRTIQRDLLELESALQGILLVQSASDQWEEDKSNRLSFVKNSRIPLIRILKGCIN